MDNIKIAVTEAAQNKNSRNRGTRKGQSISDKTWDLLRDEIKPETKNPELALIKCK